MAGKKALFYCSAAPDIDPKYNQAAREFVRAACLAGYSIASGVTTKGTMAVVCEEAAKCGGEVVGAIPRFMKGLNNPLCKNPEWVDTMSERKEAMRRGASLVVALPGGIGTLDELAETITLCKLSQMSATIVVADIDGFYAPLKALFEHFVASGMLDQGTMDSIHFVSDAAEFEKYL